MRVWLAVASLALVGCEAEVPENRFACMVDADCPPDMVCRSDGRCWRTGDGPVDGGSIEDGGLGADAGCVGGCGPTCITCGANEECNGVDCECLPNFADCDGTPGCEAHLPSDRAHCGGCGIPCADGQSCLAGTCEACVNGSDCPDDGLACTGAPTCAAGLCEHPLEAGFCLITGGCVAADTRNPGNQCEHCEPNADPMGWTHHTSSCDDGLYCTEGESCAGGTCVPLRARDCGGGRCEEDRDRCCGAHGQACCDDDSPICPAGCGVIDTGTLMCCRGVVTMTDGTVEDCPCC